jgi:hypothetical protein
MKSDAAGVMDKISGIDDVMGGSASPEFSGVALEHQEARGMRKLTPPMDNLRRTRWILTRNLFDLLRDHYREERVFYVSNAMNISGEDEEEITINQRASGRIINDISVGSYEFVIGQKPARDTFDERQFLEIMQLRQAGVAIPDHWVVRYSSLENRRELEQLLAQMAGMGEKSEEEQKMAQMQIELGMISMKAEVEKLEAEIAEIESQALLNEAKAEDLAAGEDSQAAIKDRQTLEAKLAEKKMELQLRRELGELSAASKAKSDEDKKETEFFKATQNNNAPKEVSK